MKAIASFNDLLSCIRMIIIIDRVSKLWHLSLVADLCMYVCLYASECLLVCVCLCVFMHLCVGLDVCAVYF